MATQSNIAKLPRPDLADPPNGPSAFTSLTNALDLLVIPRFNNAAARDATITSPTGGQHAWLSDSSTLTVWSTTISQWLTYGAAPGNLGRAITYMGSATMTGGTFTLTNTMADVPGCSLSVPTTKSTAMFLINFTADYSTTGVNVGTGVVACNIGGSDQSPQINYSAPTSTARSTGAQTVLYSAGFAGSLTVKLRGSIVGTTGMRLNGPHTSLSVIVFE